MARPKTEQPDAVCKPCGEKWGRYTTDKHAQFSPGRCAVCGKRTEVTNPWNYSGLKAAWKINKAPPPEEQLSLL